MPSFPSIISKSKKSSSSASELQQLLVIGNGMVGAEFCSEAVRLGLHLACDITVIGDEEVPAYNRIKLGDYAEHRSLDKLILKESSWYEDNSITLKLGSAMTSLDKEKKVVTLANGEELSYDLLVLATGSRPTLPSIEGVDHARVSLYRNIADLKKIISKYNEGENVAIIGGGLLGIEAAHTFKKLGVKTSIVQRANYLMTRQLNFEAGGELQKQIEDAGIEVHTQAQKIELRGIGDGINLKVNDKHDQHFDHVVISAGITPNTDVISEAGIECGVHGGCVVNKNLQTSDPSVFSIGECALYNGQIYGLAAPGFQMATHLAELFAGNKKHVLEEPDTSTRLKMSGVDVSVIGSPLDRGVSYVYHKDGVYFLVNVDRNRRIVGAMGVGEWEEYSDIHYLYTSKQKLTVRQLKDFKETGCLMGDAEVQNPLSWPDSRLVCNCMSVNKGQIMEAAKSCDNDFSGVVKATKASTVCGSCEQLVKGLCGGKMHATPPPKVHIGLLVASVLALIVVLGAIILPPAPIADSVYSYWAKVDRLWRDNVLKQISGYSLLGVFTIGLLISARKRLPWFKLGKYMSWRMFHIIFGIISLVVLYAHTGFHFGHNLNYWLMLVFIMINLLGAITGFVIAMEHCKNVALAKFSQVVRPYMLWGHIIFFWPLPILIIFHILSVYKY